MIRRFVAATSFWLLVATSAALLAPCALLPAWMEHRAARAAHADAQQRVLALSAENVRLARVIDHHRNDPAFIERHARREFGLTPPGVEAIPAPAQAPTEIAAAIGEAPPAPPSIIRADVETGVESFLQRFPQAQAYLDPHKRPMILAAGASLALIALVLLGRPAQRASRSSQARAPRVAGT
ncbi:MAG: septum formation initiator family protein [Planctomycetia bacterium]|nr:MAG: septum formation initiator family protein [Planctomycetia bacterium]